MKFESRMNKKIVKFVLGGIQVAHGLIILIIFAAKSIPASLEVTVEFTQEKCPAWLIILAAIAFILSGSLTICWTCMSNNKTFAVFAVISNIISIMFDIISFVYSCLMIYIINNISSEHPNKDYFLKMKPSFVILLLISMMMMANCIFNLVMMSRWRKIEAELKFQVINKQNNEKKNTNSGRKPIAYQTETMLANWIKDQKEKGLRVTVEKIQEMAQVFATENEIHEIAQIFATENEKQLKASSFS